MKNDGKVQGVLKEDVGFIVETKLSVQDKKRALKDYEEQQGFFVGDFMFDGSSHCCYQQDRIRALIFSFKTFFRQKVVSDVGIERVDSKVVKAV